MDKPSHIAENLIALPNFEQDWGLAQFNEPLTENPTDTELNDLIVAQYVDGKGLACPMPLLKLKMALKQTQMGHAVYVSATDPNSRHDIGAFCRHMGYGLFAGQTDTIFHLLITKNC